MSVNKTSEAHSTERMPKKWADDTRGAKAKAQKAASQAEKDAVRRKAEQEAEARDWARGSNSRKQCREEAEEEKRRQRERREAEKKALRDAEAAEGVRVRRSDRAKGLGKPKVGRTKGKKGQKQSVDAAMWALGLGAPIVAKSSSTGSPAKKSKKSKSTGSGSGGGGDPAAADPVPLARASSAPPGTSEPLQTISVSGLDAALAAMSSHAMGVSVEAAAAAREGDRHPERRRKAAYRAFEEREMDRMRIEEPSLKRSQIRDRVFKLWQRSPENPMNQAAAAGGGGGGVGGAAGGGGGGGGGDEVWKSAAGPVRMKRGASVGS